MDGVCFHLLLFYASPNNIATKMHKPAGQKNATTLQSKKRRVLRPFMLPLCAGQSIERWRNAAGGGDGASQLRS
jgi:hypothetical protein